MPLLEGRKALVTGASLGLGAGIAGELVARGARVLMCSRSPERLQAAAEKIAARMKEEGAAPGVHAWTAPLTVSADVTEVQTAPRLAALVNEAFGGLDILVCNAGGPPTGNFSEISDESWEEAFRLLMLGPVRILRALLPMLRASGRGRVVLNSSLTAVRPVERLLLSNALRPGLSGLVRHLSHEFGADGILINAIAPGFFDTERAREVHEAAAQQNRQTAEEVAAAMSARIPLGRPGDPAELGRAVAFLASEENTYVTGQTILVDGGLTAAP